MIKEEALEILRLYSNWNTGQTSTSRAFSGVDTEEDLIYDTRRELIIKAQQVLLK